ncbi:hypothetical protein [Kitasatospora purpeofusca]|uniref:hypothetical protein n=1 Tax=Kitasatospora purpeofusca TaxID=67352 RepID=UPI00365161E9
MRARELGYAVSEEPAIALAATAQVIARKRRDVRFRCSVLAAIFLGVAAVVAVIAPAPASEKLTSFGTVGVIIVLFLLVPLTTRTPGIEREMVEALESSPWQVWPVRLELLNGSERGPRRVVLLTPDGSAERAFEATVPESVWLGYTDGLGLLWFCGDLRFGGALASPGGTPVWPCKVIKGDTGVDRGRGDGRVQGEDSIIGDLAREAARATFRDWLA